MALTAGKDEHRLLALLDLGTQQCFDMLLLVETYLLKLIDCYHTGFVHRLQVMENLIQGYLGRLDAAQSQVEAGLSGNRIHRKPDFQRLDDLKK